MSENQVKEAQELDPIETWLQKVMTTEWDIHGRASIYIFNRLLDTPWRDMALHYFGQAKKIFENGEGVNLCVEEEDSSHVEILAMISTVKGPEPSNPDEIEGENRIVSFFRNLSPREKLIARAFDIITAAGSNCGSKVLDDGIFEATEYEFKDIQGDSELCWLHGAAELANAAC